jgi:HAMP domain-containing protein
MKEQELTSRMSEVIVTLQSFDDSTDYRYHQTTIAIAHEVGAIVQEFNQLVRELRNLIEKDPSKLPALIVPTKPEYEN